MIRVDDKSETGVEQNQGYMVIIWLDRKIMEAQFIF